MECLRTPAAVLLSLGALSAHAGQTAVTNGGFETGTLAGWYSSGTTALVGTSTPWAPLAGNWSALVVAMSAAPVPPTSCEEDPWNYRCPQPLPFSASGASAPTHTNFNGVDVGFAFLRGGYIGFDLDVQAGQVLDWNWRIFGEASPSPVGLQDDARFHATDGTVERSFNYDGTTHSFRFTTSGTWSVYFGVFQAEDPWYWSGMELDSVTLSAAVPEPAPLLLGVAGALVLLLCKRRHGAG